jgi:hypothetical protein
VIENAKTRRGEEREVKPSQHDSSSRPSLLRVFVFSILSLLLTSICPAFAAPQLTYLFPAGGRRGERVTIDVVGKELQGLRGLFATGSGISAEVVDAGKSEAKSKRLLQVTIAADAPLGIQSARLSRTARARRPTGSASPRP